MSLKWASNRGAKSLGRLPFATKNRKYRRKIAVQKAAHFQLPFRRWDGRIGPWKEHFGKGRGQVYSLDGSRPNRICNEIEVAKILRGVRDRAFWFSAFNTAKMPEIWRPWVRSMDELPPWLENLDSAIRQIIRAPAGGMPDVVAWNKKSPLLSAIFVECKGLNETFKEAQEDWMGAALRKGVRNSQFGVSIRAW